MKNNKIGQAVTHAHDDYAEKIRSELAFLIKIEQQERTQSRVSTHIATSANDNDTANPNKLPGN